MSKLINVSYLISFFKRLQNTEKNINFLRKKKLVVNLFRYVELYFNETRIVNQCFVYIFNYVLFKQKGLFTSICI